GSSGYKATAGGGGAGVTGRCRILAVAGGRGGRSPHFIRRDPRHSRAGAGLPASPLEGHDAGTGVSGSLPGVAQGRPGLSG
ncbi:hypothetical protein, partial [Salmonella enterica]|uniref:hypothetical protein n=1 Tax=Salmonella enterica TaxID=28901 RepID=UPI0035C0EDD4